MHCHGFATIHFVDLIYTSRRSGHFGKTLILYPFSEVLLQNGAAHPTILYE